MRSDLFKRFWQPLHQPSAADYDVVPMRGKEELVELLSSEAEVLFN